MIKIEIDGKSLEVEQGSMIIEAADHAGIHIPRFCYHKKLSIAANCRMCLVEVEKSRKPLPACATPVTDGMKVFTQSQMALEAQRAVMEFLLINHPLDCPICDQGGECELQDVSMGYGGDISQYTEGKRTVKDKDVGPLIKTFLTRCIQCTRCVRFGEEISGYRELGATGRGEHMEIGTYIQKSIDHELSGNIIDICPVGALTSKPFLYSARTWELQQHPSIAPHDCLGSHVYLHVFRDKVKRVVPREQEAINEVWLSDRDRFSYTGLHSDDRMQKSHSKDEQKGWQSIDWAAALEKTARELQKIVAQYGADEVGGLIHPSATLEEHYLFQKLLRGFGCNNIDHRLHQLDFSDQSSMPRVPGIDFSIQDVEKADALLVIGSKLRKELPLMAHRVRKAALNQAKITLLNPEDYEFNFDIYQKVIVPEAEMVMSLAGIAKACLTKANNVPSSATDMLEKVIVQPEHQKIADALHAAERPLLVLGQLALHHPQASKLRFLAKLIKQLTNSQYGELNLGSNTAGAWLAGSIPHREAAGSVLSEHGKNCLQMIQSPLKAYILMNLEPEHDMVLSQEALLALKQAKLVIVISPYITDTIKSYAHIALPMANFTETSGTFINAERKWQSFSGAVKPVGEARPAWKILRVLGNLLKLPAFDYVSSDQIREEIKAKWDSMPQENPVQWHPIENLLVKSQDHYNITEIPIYRVDSLVRRAMPLQQTEDGLNAHE